MVNNKSNSSKKVAKTSKKATKKQSRKTVGSGKAKTSSKVSSKKKETVNINDLMEAKKVSTQNSSSKTKANVDIGFFASIKKIFIISLIYQVVISVWFMLDYNSFKTYMPDYLLSLISIGIFVYYGYLMVAEQSLKAGEIIKNLFFFGAIVGLLSAIMNIIVMTLSPTTLNLVANQMVVNTQGAISLDDAVKFMKIGMYVSFIASPIISAIFSFIFGGLSSFITKKVVESK